MIGLKSPSCKLRAVCEIHQDDHRIAELDIVAEVVRMALLRGGKDVDLGKQKISIGSGKVNSTGGMYLGPVEGEEDV